MQNEADLGLVLGVHRCSKQATVPAQHLMDAAGVDACLTARGLKILLSRHQNAIDAAPQGWLTRLATVTLGKGKARDCNRSHETAAWNHLDRSMGTFRR